MHIFDLLFAKMANCQGLDGSRMPSEVELELATIHGESFGQVVNQAFS